MTRYCSKSRMARPWPRQTKDLATSSLSALCDEGLVERDVQSDPKGSDARSCELKTSFWRTKKRVSG